MTFSNDESAVPPIDRFDEYARELYYELRLSGRTPIAMIGSGMSVSYGGVSWKASVELALAEAERQLSAVSKSKKASARDKSRAERELGGIRAMMASGLDDASDKYLALELCKQGMALARSISGSDAATEMDSFERFMQRVFFNDDHFIATTIAKRLALNHDETQALLGKSTEFIQELGNCIYSMRSLQRLSKGNTRLQRLITNLHNEYTELTTNPVLPIDRRSILCVFLYEKTDAQRRKHYRILHRYVGASRQTGLRARPPSRPLIDPIRVLHERLGVTRFITLNFDFEIENSIMIDDFRSTRGRTYGFQDAINDKLLQREPGVGHQPVGAGVPDTGGVTRRFTDGLAASSDIYSPSAVARLFEFGLNSPDYRAQVLHLHGRADLPETMVLTEGDLDRVYRRNPRARTALEQALDVVLTGNPVLFAGIGLSEAEITRALRLLVSEGRVTPENPAFAIQAFDRGDPNKSGGSDAWRRQMALFRQYGIHLIDAGHPRHGDGGGLPTQLQALKILDECLIVSPIAPHDLAAAVTACRNSALIKSLKLDGIVFESLLNRLVSVRPNADQTALARDYIGKLQEKLYSLCVENEIKRLAEETDRYFLRTSLRAHDPASSGTKSVKTELNALVRDSALKQPAPPGSTRHSVCFYPPASHNAKADQIAGELLAQPYGVRCYLAPLGWGKGAVARQLKELLVGKGTANAPEHEYILINCNFALEFESAILQLLRFAWAQSGKSGTMPTLNRIAALREALAAGLQVDPTKTAPLPKPKPTIILTGIERLIDSGGTPLTPEFELVLKALFDINVRVRWRIIVIGTPDREGALRRFGLQDVDLIAKPDAPDATSGFLGFLTEQVKATRACKLKSGAIARDIEMTAYASTAAIVPNSPRSEASKHLLRVVLERWHDIAFDAVALPDGTPHPPHEIRALAEFDKTLLTQLCFIGLPIEPSVLSHLPSIKASAGQPSLATTSVTELLTASCSRLAKFGLILNLEKFQGEGGDRVAVHRTVLAELRDRYGVRSGEEMLSNSFCLTLAVSMPTDLVIADIDIHKELKDAVGRLRGAWKDADLAEGVKHAFTELRKLARLDQYSNALLADNAWFNEKIARLERLMCLSITPMQASLRAAGGIVRGFFSAATLVGIIPEERKRDDWRAGEFADHKDRIGKLLARMREAQRAQSDADALITELTLRLPVAGRHLTTIKAALPASEPPPPAPAFYSGELVWLLNERGVIALIQGDLYAAEYTFREAEAALKRYKGLGAHQSWRRLEINRTLLRIERGRINEARLKLEAIGPAIAGAQAGAHAATEEDKIIDPLIKGYLGLCDFLGGHYESADQNLRMAIRGLVRTDQQRALALFYWRRGELLLNREHWDEASEVLKLAIAAAEAGRQIDVVWRARLSLTRLQRQKDSRLAEVVFREAQIYAEVMDLPRISVIALNKHAAHKLILGDLQAAAALATQSMQIATNHGMVLNRISARTLMGTILLRSGGSSGEYLLRRAIAHADRIGYQLHVDIAKKALLATAAR